MFLGFRGIYWTARHTGEDEGNGVYANVIRASQGCLVFGISTDGTSRTAFFVLFTNLISEM